MTAKTVYLIHLIRIGFESCYDYIGYRENEYDAIKYVENRLNKDKVLCTYIITESKKYSKNLN